MSVDNIEKAEEVAKEFIESREKAKAEAETAKLTPEQKADIEKKESEAKAAEEAAAKAKQENEAKAEEILDKPVEELTDEEKALLDELNKEEEELDEKTRMEKGLKKSRKRIDRLTAKLREAEEERSTLIAGVEELRKEVEKLKNGNQTKKESVKPYSEIEREGIARLIVEDAELPREQRREMANEDLQEWFADDPVAAQEWISERAIRRAEYKKQYENHIANKDKAEDFIGQQEASIKRAISKYPNMKPDKEIAVLLKENTMDETIAILEKKYPEYKLANEIVNEAIKLQGKGEASILDHVDFGDRLVAELDKRLAKDKSSSGDKPKKVYSEEEVQQRIKEAQEMERQRLARVDTESSSSSSKGVGGTPKKELSAEEQFLARHGEKAGMTKEQIDRIIKRHNDRMKSGAYAVRHAKGDGEDEA